LTTYWYMLQRLCLLW